MNRSAIPASYRRFIRWEVLAIVLILIIGFAARFYALGRIPGGVNQDEASTAYDAFAIGYYGIDRVGNFLPLVLVSWGSGMYALAAYVAIPFYYLFGVSVFSLRLASFFIGMCSWIAASALIKKVLGTSSWVFPLFFVAIMPWHVMQSRWLLDSNFFPQFFLFGVLCQVYYGKNKYFLPLSSVFFGLSMYAYGTSYLVVPLYMALSYAFLLFSRKATLPSLIAGGSVFLVFFIPIAWFVGVNSFGFPELHFPFSIPKLHSIPRYQTTSSFSSFDFAQLKGSAKSVWDLLRYQDDGLSYNRTYGFGMVYTWSLPLGIVGLAALALKSWKKKISSAEILIFMWFFVSVLLGLFLRDLNINRMNIIVFPFLILASIGIWSAREWNKSVFVMLIAIYAMAFPIFLSEYVYENNPHISNDFNESFLETMEFAISHSDSNVCVTDTRVLPYIFTLLAEKTDPREYIRTHVMENPGAEFETITSFGRYTFGLHRCDLGSFRYAVARNEEVQSLIEDGFVLEKAFKEFSFLRR